MIAEEVIRLSHARGTETSIEAERDPLLYVKRLDPRKWDAFKVGMTTVRSRDA